MEVVQQLGLDQRMGDLHHGIAELQGVHEQHERRHADPVLAPQSVPVISSDLDLPGQRRVEGAEAGRQHLGGGRGGRDGQVSETQLVPASQPLIQALK